MQHRRLQHYLSKHLHDFAVARPAEPYRFNDSDCGSLLETDLDSWWLFRRAITAVVDTWHRAE